MTIPLTLTHLRFDVVAQQNIKLGDYQAGDWLRNALAAVMLRSVCVETPRGKKPTPEHAALCPVCWLLAAEEDPGRVRRAYTLVPPQPPRQSVQAGERFSFGLTLFGEGFQYLPYFVLAVPEMGRGGVGPGRGSFALEAIWAVNPLNGGIEVVLPPGENTVRVPESNLHWNDAQTMSEKLLAEDLDDGHLRLHFLTPTRLIQAKQTLKLPDFGVLFRRLLRRIDELGEQFAGAQRRAKADIYRLHRLADQVRLVDADVRWVDLMSWSGRTRRKTPMGGFVGTAVYRSSDWGVLLPWLVLGQGTQVGKLAVKGNGVFEIIAGHLPEYWSWMREVALEV